MDAFHNLRDGASLANNIDVTAHRISCFKKVNNLRTNCDIFITQASISIAEPIDVQIDELGNNIIQMYQFIGIINDEQVPGLENVLNYE